MTDAIADFATLAAHALHDIATGTLVDALAAVEHQLGALRREQRHAGQAVARALHRLASGQPMAHGGVEGVVYACRCAVWWSLQSPTRQTMLEVGRCLERGAVVVDLMRADECVHLRGLLRAVLSEVQRAVVAADREAVRHVAA